MVYDLINKRLSQVLHRQQANFIFSWVYNFRFYWIHGWARCSVQSHVDWMAQVWVKNLAPDSWVQFGVQVIKMRKRRSLTWPIWTPSTNSTMESVCFINQSLIWQTDQGKRALLKNIKSMGFCRFEPRWLESLSRLELPIQIVWGDSDAVAPMSIPQTLSKLINPQYLSFTTLPGAGKQLFVSLPVCTNCKYVKNSF